MARRGYDDFDREMTRDRRGRDPREIQRERDPREVQRERDPREIQRERDPREMQRERDPRELRQEQDWQERQRRSIDLQSERREASARYEEYFLPGEGINCEVIKLDICRYLGNDATVRPYEHSDVGCRLFTGFSNIYSG